MWYLIVGGIVLICLLLIGFVSIYNRYQEALIKMDEAENNIDVLLQKKLDLLERCVPLIDLNDEKDVAVLKGVTKLKSKKLDHFDLSKELHTIERELHSILDNNTALQEVEQLKEVVELLFETNEDLEAAMKFYNDTVVIYNKLIKCFPSNLIRLFFHYKEKKFYTQEKEVDFEILKQQ